ncbi:MAG: M56 family metallopeptidase [Saprospiraceae bacterium]|nr:M56 family metallopeptidase [Saprospiraceae bacterium]
MIHHLSVPQYLLESSFCLVVFYVFYLWFLKRETYFQFNRFYLISTALLSLVIPIINIDFNSTNHIAGAEQLYPFLYQVNDIQIGIQQTISQEYNILHISIADVINWVYLFGLFVMCIKLFSGLFKLFGIINRSPKLKDKNHTLLISEDVPAASFFSYIFWKDKHDKSDPVQKTILDHEMVHVRQWHSMDVIIMEIMVIIKWFNPLIYLFRNSLKKTHEFIADRYVTNQMGDKIQYARILLSNSAPTDLPPVSNHFYGNIKERIEMLTAKQSAWFKQIKYVAIIPLTIVLLSLFSFDLSDKLPQPLKSSLQSIENSMMAAIDKNIVSLNVDQEKEEHSFFVAWSNMLNIKIQQTFDVQDFIFEYSKEHLNELLAAHPTITQNGKQLKVFVDTLQVITSSGKKEIPLEKLQDDDFRDYFIDSLGKHDQIVIGLKSFSEMDSLYVKLHIGVDKTSYQKVEIDEHLQEKVIRWGQRKIVFNENFKVDGRRLNLDESVTDNELQNMLNNKLEVRFDDGEFVPLPTTMQITFKVSRANNSRLASIETDKLNQFKKEKGLGEEVVFIKSYYHGKSYDIEEESKTYTLADFYTEKEAFKNWVNTCQNGDIIRIKVEGEHSQFGNYEFNLRYRDENEAISAPFPIDFPNTTGDYSNFQIAMSDEGKSYVRIDTKDYRNQKIVDAYAGSASYEIIHIDNFKTKSRIRTETLPTGQFELEETIDPEIRDLDILRINDYYTDKDQLLRMDWGKMVSMPNIGNYSIKEFKRSSKQDLTLFVGTKDLKMVRFDLLIIPENGKIKRIRTDKTNTQSIRNTLAEVKSNTSIYVDNIILNVDNTNVYYPYNFVFTVE